MNQQRITRTLLNIIWLSMLLILFLPLIMHSRFFFPFIVPRNVAFRVIVEIAFAAYLVLAYLEPSYRPKMHRLAWAVLAFLGVSFLAALVGLNFNRSFWGNYERMSGLFHQLHLVLYFFVLYNTFKRHEAWHSLLTFSIFTSSLMSLLGFAQWLQIPFLLASSGGERISGSVGNATFFATYLLFNLFFLLYFWAKERRFDLKLFALSYLVFDGYMVVAALLNRAAGSADWGAFNWLKAPLLNHEIQYPKLMIPFAVLQILIFAVWFYRHRPQLVRILISALFMFEFFIFFNTQTRGALISFLVSLLFLAIVGLFLPKLPKPVKATSAVLLLVTMAIPVLLVAAKDSPLVRQNTTLSRLATISRSDVTTESRLAAWQASWQGWSETPRSLLIGYGPENYYYAFNKNFPAKIFRDAGSQIWFDRAHNIIFDVGVTTGLAGLAAYLAILGLMVVYLVTIFRRDGSVSESWLFIGFLVAYFIQNFFVFDTLSSEILFYLLIGYVSYRWLDRQKPDDGREEDRAAPAAHANWYVLAPPLAAVMLVGGLLVNVQTLRANNYIYKALTEKGSVDQSVKYLKRAIHESVTGKSEAQAQLATYVLGLRGKPNVSAERLRQFTDYVIDEFRQSKKEEPKNVRNHLYLASVYDGTVSFYPGSIESRLKQSIAVLKEAIPLSPTRPQIYFELGQAYVLLDDLEQAARYFQQGVDQAPWVGDSQWVMLTVGVLTNNQTVIDRQLEIIGGMKWKPTPSHYQKAIDVATRVKNYPFALELYSKLIALEPSRAGHWSGLAAVYAKIGDNERARTAAAEAVAADPSFAAEAKKFLELLDKGDLLEK